MENTQKNTQIRRRSSTKVRSMAQVGMLAAVATVLMLFEFPLPFVPSFYKLDISEIPVLLGTFAMGPVAGVMTECIKILLNFVINGTDNRRCGRDRKLPDRMQPLCAGRADLSEDAHKKGSDDRTCRRNSIHDADRMRAQCLYPASDLCCSIWNAA